MKKRESKYAVGVRAGYEHPHHGRTLFRLSDDASLEEKEQAPIRAGSEAERSFEHLWFALPDDARAWCCGRLAATDPQIAAELLEDVQAVEMWHVDYLGRRARFMDESDDGAILLEGYRPMAGVRVREDGKAITDSGELVDLDA